MIRRLKNTDDMTVGDQLLYERYRNLLLWRGVMTATVISILALSALLLVGSMYFRVTDRQDDSRDRVCQVLLLLHAKTNDLEDLKC